MWSSLVYKWNDIPQGSRLSLKNIMIHHFDPRISKAAFMKMTSITVTITADIIKGLGLILQDA